MNVWCRLFAPVSVRFVQNRDMLMKKFTLLVVITTLVCGQASSSDTLPLDPISINPEKVSVAGMSAGAMMAHQLHIAYPEIFSGAALLAGGPFGCAGGSLATAMSRCMGKVEGSLPVDQFAEEIRAASITNQLGDLSQLVNDKVWAYHGTLDLIVAPEQSEALVELYKIFIDEDQITYVDNVAAAHTFPTLTNGNACDAVASPFVSACNFDAAGESLQFLYGELNAPAENILTDLIEVKLPHAEQAGLLQSAFLFVPEACRNESAGCKAQMVLHGCNQSSAQIGTGFITESDYLGWAEANNIVLAFPQVAVSATNPFACWDWWGYTGESYRWRNGKQMQVLADWMLVLEQP
jgi:hypothetical protein